jgi:hypothetical protein
LETRVRAWVLNPTMLPWIGKGEAPDRTPGNDKQASSVTRAVFGERQRPKKPVRRCFKPRPSLRTRYAGFASGCRLGVSKAGSPSGGCPASCPDAHQPARDHRHVRNWASSEIRSHFPFLKRFFGFWASKPKIFHARSWLILCSPTLVDGTGGNLRTLP